MALIAGLLCQRIGRLEGALQTHIRDYDARLLSVIADEEGGDDDDHDNHDHDHQHHRPNSTTFSSALSTGTATLATETIESVNTMSPVVNNPQNDNGKDVSDHWVTKSMNDTSQPTPTTPMIPSGPSTPSTSSDTDSEATPQTTNDDNMRTYSTEPADSPDTPDTPDSPDSPDSPDFGESSPMRNNPVPGWEYIGCYADLPSPSILYSSDNKVINEEKMSNLFCANLCKNYAFFSTEGGRECHCGNETGRMEKAPGEWACGHQCGGTKAERPEFCGGWLYMSLWRKVD